MLFTMKTHISLTRNRSFCSLFAPLFLVLLTCSCWLSAQERMEKYFIGIELNDVLCGYSEVIVTQPQAPGTPYLNIDQKTYISFKAIGQDISQKQLFTTWGI